MEREEVSLEVRAGTELEKDWQQQWLFFFFFYFIEL